jgi:hypothetical protein
MKIGTPDTDFIDLEQVKLDLQKFIDQEETWQSPPCPGCKDFNPQSCSPDCSEASTSLSIDPERYPVERNVIAVTYELNATRLLKTCWSCEGHMRDGEDKIWKLPQICFYSQTAIYPKLVSTYLSKLFIQKRLKYNWNLFLSEISQSIYPTFCIRPDLTNEPTPSLGLLQNDLKEIAKSLHSRLKDEAKDLLNKMNK